MKALDFGGIRIRWLGHDSFKLDFNGRIMYIDPFQIHEKENADLILVTHTHYDHCSIEDIKKLSSDKTIIVSTADSASKYAGKVQLKELRLVKPGDKLLAYDVKIECIAAYNNAKEFHPKANEWVGYLFEIDSVVFYHAGDTDYIPEMQNISCDIAFLPVSGTYVMDAKDAASAARKLMPKIAIPMHYGKIIGTRKDAEEFKKLCDFCRVELMD